MCFIFAKATKQKTISMTTNIAYMNIQTIDTAYIMPATNAAHRAFNAQPSQLKMTAIPTQTICGVTNAAAMPAPMASAPSDAVTPLEKYTIK